MNAIKKGLVFTKSVYKISKDKKRVVFVFTFSIGINAVEPEFYRQTANWFFLGGGFNLKEGELLKGIDLRWNIKKY